MKKLILSLFFILATAASAQESQALFVSPNGSDSNDGRTANTPFQTLEQAQKASQEISIKIIYLRGGLYSRTSALQLTEKDEGQSWLAYPGETPVLDGGDSTSEAFSILRSKNIAIRWMKIQNFAHNGIKAVNSTQLFFDSNTIINIHSDGWNQGGIVLLNGVADAIVSHNHVQNIGYSGLLSANGASDFRGLVRFEFNRILDTCLAVHDCGALYSDDRTHNSIGVVMKNNIIGNFGKPSTGGRGIYLDDNQSNAVVTENIVYGEGDWPIQIHGGDHHLIRNNIFDITVAGQLGLYQWIDTGNFPNYGMKENIFTCNVVYHKGDSISQVWDDRSGGNSMVQASGNIYYSSRKVFSKHNTLDSKLKTGNADDLNLEKNGYQFTSDAPKFCGDDEFKAIDTSAVGPLANTL